MNLTVYRRSTFLIILISIAFQSLSAATRVSQASGSWNSAATWGGTVPVANDDIVISTGTIVSLNSSLPSSSSFGNVIINEGGSLVVGVNGVTFRIKGSLSNDGVINFWQSATFQADIMLYGNSIWSGSGSWNLSTINVQNNALEVADGMSLTINTSFTAYAGSSFNKLNRHLNTTLYIKGTINSMISSFPDFYYGHLVISKTAGTVSFSPSNSSNVINLSGDLTLVNPTDRLIVEANNTLSLQGRATGAGVISGSTTSSLIVDNIEAPAIDPLRILSGTSFKELIVNRRAGVTLSSGFIIRENLRLNNSCLLTLPPNTLTLGVNGTNPTAGSLSGNGRFVGSSNSSISIRGKDTTSVILRFDQGTLASYTLNNLIIDKQAGKAGIENGNLLLTGKLDISDKNIFSIGAGTLIIRIVPVFIGNGCLSGSKNASLRVEGITQSGYPLRFDQSTPLGNILKSYTQSRNATITLANKLNITEEVSLTGNESVLVSNGNLTLLSSPAGNACISPLVNNADVQGDVNVQVYISGDGQNMKFRGYRSLSSPLNDDQIVAGQKRSLGQLKDHIIVTGPGGIANGFDQGGNAQPFAQTLTFYNPLAVPGSSLFTPVATIYESLKPGTGFLAFYRGAQQGSYALNYNKLNSPYSPPEATTVVYKGPINKYVLPSITLRTNKDTTDSHRGYNLIGNPYPSAIDWGKVSKSTGVNDEVVVLKPGGGTATYLNGVSNNGGSPIVQTGQGFYVRTDRDGSTVSFAEECKTAASAARLLVTPLVGKSAYARVSDSEPATRELLKVNLTNDFDIDETTIVFEDGQSSNADYNDAMYFSGSSVNLASLSANGKRLAINFMPDLADTNEVRLSVNAAGGGNYRLNFTETPSVAASVFLRDAYHQDHQTEIKKNSSYCFSIDRTDPNTFGEKRFTLIFKSNPDQQRTGKHDSPEIKVYPNPVVDRLYFNYATDFKGPLQIAVFDIKGEQMDFPEVLPANTASFDVSSLSPGIYILKLRSAIGKRRFGEIRFIKI